MCECVLITCVVHEQISFLIKFVQFYVIYLHVFQGFRLKLIQGATGIECENVQTVIFETMCNCYLSAKHTESSLVTVFS
jgi:hypothetical protein